MKKFLEYAAKLYDGLEEVSLSRLFAPNPKPSLRGSKKQTCGRKHKEPIAQEEPITDDVSAHDANNQENNSSACNANEHNATCDDANDDATHNNDTTDDNTNKPAATDDNANKSSYKNKLINWSSTGPDRVSF